MCDYCGCRSMALIEELGAEHERLTDLVGQVHRGVARGDMGWARDRFGELVALLRVHTAVEEAGVFSALRAAGELGGQVDALLAEHASVWESIGGLGRRWEGEVALRLIAELGAHIAREEYDLFPASLVAITPAGWDAAERAAAQIRRGFAEVSACAA